MKTADTVTFPCSRLRDYHTQLVRPAANCLVVPHVGGRRLQAKLSNSFHLVHAGSLGSGETTRRNSTVSMLRALAQFLEKRPRAKEVCRLTLVGPEDRPTMSLANELNLGAYVSCTGRVGYSESLTWMDSATVCLLVEGNMPEGIFLPSKFPDYVQAGKPVIAMSPAIGTIADFASNIGVTQVAVDSPSAIEAAFIRHFDAFDDGSIASLAPDEKLRNQFDGNQIGRQLRDLFSCLAHSPPP